MRSRRKHGLGEQRWVNPKAIEGFVFKQAGKFRAGMDWAPILDRSGPAV